MNPGLGTQQQLQRRLWFQPSSSWHLGRKTEDVTHQDRDLIPQNVYKDQSTKLHIKTWAWISDCFHSKFKLKWCKNAKCRYTKKASLKHNRNIFLVFVCHLFRSLSTKIKVIQTISEWSFVTFSIIFRDSSPFSAPFSKHCPHSCHESFTRAWRYSFRKYLDSKISMHKSHHPDILEDWDCQE